MSDPTTYEVTKYPGIRFVLKEDYEKMKSLAEKLAEALLFVVNEHKLSNRELLRMGARPNKPCATVLKALEALSLAREMLAKDAHDKGMLK
jgi:hypothetical protein